MSVYIDRDQLEEFAMNCVGGVVTMKQIHEFPAVHVPPHGRLIDADALMLEIQEYIEEYGWETDEHGWHNEKWCAMKEAAMVIDDAPTIIPVEEPEP